MNHSHTSFAAGADVTLRSPEAAACPMRHLECWILRNSHLLWRVLKNRPRKYKIDDLTAESLDIQGKWILLTPEGIARTNGEILYTREQIITLVGQIMVRMHSEPVPAEVEAAA